MKIDLIYKCIVILYNIRKDELGMLKKIIIIENDNKAQCDSEEEVIRLLLDDNYYELSEKEKVEKREIKAMANCLNNKMKILNDIDINVDNIDNKFIIKDEMTYVLSLLITNNIMLLERIDSDIYTSTIDKSKIEDNYIIVNKFAKNILENYMKTLKREGM